MTVYARGYRPYTGRVRGFRLRFLPIFRSGYRDATRGGWFWTLKSFILMFVVIDAFLLYFLGGPVARMAREMSGGRPTDATLVDAAVLREGLRSILHLFHQQSAIFVVLLSVFVGAGLVADDMRTKALPLYLVRPLTPLDYFVGKFLVPVAVIVMNVLVPGLALIVLAALMRPSDETFRFLYEQRDLALVLVEHAGLVAVSYTSLVLLVSTLARRRVAAIVGASVVFLGGTMMHGFGRALRGPLRDVVHACSLPAGGFRLLRDGIGGEQSNGYPPGLPSATAALVAAGALFLVCAFAVLRRARTTEVVA